METILGIDPSLRSTGFAVLSVGQEMKLLSLGTIKTTKKNENERVITRLLYIKQQVKFLCQEYSPDVAILEDFSYASKGNAKLQLAGLGFLIQEFFIEEGIPMKIVQPRSLKKVMTGNGNSDKVQIIDAVNMRWGLSLKKKDNDIADAIALCEFYLNLKEL